MEPEEHHYTEAERAKFTEEERRTTTPGDLRPRFGWQEGDEVVFYDDMGNRLTLEQWKERMKEKGKRLAKEKEG